MYAMTTRERFGSDVDFKPQEPSELHYWRKHPDLHGWMEALYFVKGGRADSFNCVAVRLTSDDLDLLEDVVKRNELPPTEGFFFGQTTGEEREDDLAFIAKARAAIADGQTVYYDSWW